MVGVSWFSKKSPDPAGVWCPHTRGWVPGTNRAREIPFLHTRKKLPSSRPIKTPLDPYCYPTCVSEPQSQPQEPWNCRPLPAEKQQEILVEGDKETAVVTHLGAAPPAPEPLSWLCLGETCQHCWKWSFSLDRRHPSALFSWLLWWPVISWHDQGHTPEILCSLLFVYG